MGRECDHRGDQMAVGAPCGRSKTKAGAADQFPVLACAGWVRRAGEKARIVELDNFFASIGVDGIKIDKLTMSGMVVSAAGNGLDALGLRNIQSCPQLSNHIPAGQPNHIAGLERDCRKQKSGRDSTKTLIRDEESIGNRARQRNRQQNSHIKGETKKDANKACHDDEHFLWSILQMGATFPKYELLQRTRIQPILLALTKSYFGGWLRCVSVFLAPG
jgi:hypothetical protein